ncbi:MAG: exonuclease domain-containing protein [Proteobacteria bacterium]|nr:exonuclease domain-containing protein [Pseudomonadota bacterium]
MNNYSHFAIEEGDVIRPQVSVDPVQWRLLRRLRIPDRFNDPQSGTIKRALVIDVETTGLSTENDDVIQLAMLPFDYEPESGRILTVQKARAFEGLREPAVPISAEASLITGITAEMVAGKSIDEAANQGIHLKSYIMHALSISRMGVSSGHAQRGESNMGFPSCNQVTRLSPS